MDFFGKQKIDEISDYNFRDAVCHLKVSYPFHNKNYEVVKRVNLVLEKHLKYVPHHILLGQSYP